MSDYPSAEGNRNLMFWSRHFIYTESVEGNNRFKEVGKTGEARDRNDRWVYVRRG